MLNKSLDGNEVLSETWINVCFALSEVSERQQKVIVSFLFFSV